MYKYFLLLFLFCFFLSNAQTVESNFGEVGVQDFQDTYEPESDAVVLLDRGSSKFQSQDQFYILFTRTTRIRINKKSGLHFADISIPFYEDGYGKTEEIISIEAYSYNIDSDKGLVSREKVNSFDIFEEDVNERWKMKKFGFADVREGSIIEYKYVLKTPFLYNPPDWEFQRSIPVKESSYEIYLTPFYEYTYLLQGAKRFDGHSSVKSRETDTFSGITYNFMVHKYTMKNLPAFKDESFITSKNDYITKLDFQLSKVNYPGGGSKDIMTTWPVVNNDFLDSDSFGKYLKQSSKIADDILDENPELKAGSEMDQIQAIVNFVKYEFSWDGYTRVYATEKAKDFYDKKQGNSAEINLFLISLLQEAGFTAHPVILSTRSHGKVHPEYPFSHYFNDVIGYVEAGERGILIDGTDQLLAYDHLPVRCLNETGLIVEEDGERWVSLENKSKSSEYYYMELAIDPIEMQTNVVSMNRMTDYAGYLARKSIFNDEGRLKESELGEQFDILSDIEFTNAEDPTKTYIVSFKGSKQLEGYSNKILIQPFFSLVPQETPLKSEIRKYPVDMIYKRSQKLISKITIPEGFRILEQPKAFKIDDALVHAELTCTINGDVLMVNGDIEFKNSSYESVNYAKLRSHYAQIISGMNQMVIIEKTEIE